MPASNRSSASKAFAMSEVKMVPDMPYRTELEIRMASSKPSQSTTESTGPKISSWAISESQGTSRNTVGCT